MMKKFRGIGNFLKKCLKNVILIIYATEVYNNRIGVCHHFTKLYNSLLYSLGYQCIYVTGYACDKNDYFDKSYFHAGFNKS